MNNYNIDAVVAWVNGNDPAWQAERNRYKNVMHIDPSSNSNVRYQDWENLHYWFRAVENTMPWLHSIFFITWGHLPDFLNTEHPKLRVIRHTDYIPEQYLPTFNSGTIEMNIHRIEELSENYILFNDDFIPLSPIPETYYFRDNILCDEAVESPIMPVDIGPISRYACALHANDMIIINRNFDKREVQENNKEKWFWSGYGDLLERNRILQYWNHFVGFHDPHIATPFKKQTLKKIWEVEGEALDMGSRNRFRAESDVNQHLVRYWQLCEGNFYPQRAAGKSFEVRLSNVDMIAEGIRQRKWQMVSLNEDCTPQEFEIIKKKINDALAELFPEKSSYEK